MRIERQIPKDTVLLVTLTEKDLIDLTTEIQLISEKFDGKAITSTGVPFIFDLVHKIIRSSSS